MKKVLMVDNFDSFTFNLVQYFREAGIEVATYRNDSGLEVVEQEKPDLIVISPGPSSPQNAGISMKLINEYAGRLPIFGVCLGMQAIAEAFGTRIKPLSIEEILHGGASPIEHDGKTIFSGIEQGFEAARYHSLGAYENEVNLPLIVTATTTSTETGKKIVMGMRHKELPIEGVQFHPESVLTMEKEAGRRIIENVLREYT